MSPIFKRENIVSISAICVSVLTLLVFIYQTNLIRQQQFLSVYPYLSLGSMGTGSLKYKYL
ncbi:MAG: hypothetical protein AAFN92_17065, partial [Bacteroidota bacterium]